MNIYTYYRYILCVCRYMYVCKNLQINISVYVLCVQISTVPVYVCIHTYGITVYILLVSCSVCLLIHCEHI